MSLVPLSAALLALGYIAVALLEVGPADSDGQITFVPVDALPTVATRPAESSLEIHQCTQREQGLEVLGSVRTEKTTVTIGVEGTQKPTPGVRVGQAYASHAGLLPGASVGDFRVVLPWATPDVTLAVLEVAGSDDFELASDEERCPDHQWADGGV